MLRTYLLEHVKRQLDGRWAFETWLGYPEGHQCLILSSMRGEGNAAGPADGARAAAAAVGQQLLPVLTATVQADPWARGSHFIENLGYTPENYRA